MNREIDRRSQARFRLALAALILFGLGVIAAALRLAPRVVPDVYVLNDFYDYYIGARLFWDGHYPCGVTPEFARLAQQYGVRFMWGTGYNYPPVLVLLLWPFLLLRPEPAAWVWAGASLLTLGILVYLVARRVSGPWRSLLVTCYMLSYTPVIYSIGSGQVNILVLAALTAYLLARSDGIRAAGLALASLVKVFPALFTGKEILQGRFRFALLSAALMVGALVIPAVLRGPGVVVDYFTRVLPEINHAFHADMSNQSLNGLFSRLLADPTLAGLAVPHGVLVAADLIATAAILAGLLFVTWRRRYDEPVLTLLWLAGLTLIAGRNMFWNFAPCVFIGIYLIVGWEGLAGWQRGLFIASALITNLLWHFVYALGYAMTPADLPLPRLVFTLIFSLGTVSLVLKAAALLGEPRGRRREILG